jgi:hypothetical protein
MWQLVIPTGEDRSTIQKDGDDRSTKEFDQLLSMADSLNSNPDPQLKGDEHG